MTYYEQTIADTERQLTGLRARTRGFITGEVVTFILAVGTLILYTTDYGRGWMLALPVVLLILYFCIRHADSRNDKVISRLEDIHSACVHERNYMQGQFGDFDAGTRYADPRHPFTFDLDIFGPESLYQRVCRTVTTGGSDALANALMLTDGPHDERQGAIAELSADAERLTEFKQWGQRGIADTSAVGRALERIQAVRLPRWTGSRIVRWAAAVYLVVFLSALAYSIATQTHLLDVVWWCVVNFFAIYIICNSSIGKVTSAVGGLMRQLGTYVHLVASIERAEFADPLLKQLQSRLAGASQSLQALADILQKLESRGNILGLIIFDMLFLWDYHILNSFARWQRRYANRFGQWIDVVSEMDMLVSMATFRYNERGLATDAEVVGDQKVVYEARGLFHPFLGRRAVANDFTIADRNFYIITGANMAGKSTFLRSLGINYVLAMNGMPVFAKKLVVSRFGLFTSMRTTDDLTHGISYFNAELRRLRQIVDSLSDLRPHLIILDEILKGTNSEDKLSGSRLFLEYVARKNVTGVIATHDLKLSEMETSLPETFHNYCFEIDLGTDVTYSYKITRGVARNQNATFLLRKMLNDEAPDAQR